MARTDDKEASPSGSTIHDDSDTSCYAIEDEEDTQIHLGPKISIKEHLEKDKDDESLRNWKEQLLGRVDVSQVTDMTKVDKIEAKRTKPGTGMKREIEAK
nr:Rho GDP-dissociation inhibitor 1-like [Tanacetum cinerariifolium]